MRLCEKVIQRLRCVRYFTAVFVISLSGCVTSTFGPKTVAPASFDYNEAISRSWDEQLLLNLVRLRYRDNPLFVDVNSVTSSYSLNRNASVGARGSNGTGTEISGGVGVSLAENPVVSYSYLKGGEFAQRMLSPLSAADLRVLAQSGWSIERLLLCCYQSLNGIENSFGATGPTPDVVPDYEDFQRIAMALRKLQLARLIHWEYDGEGSFIEFDETAGAEKQLITGLLKLNPQTRRFTIVPRRDSPSQDQVEVRTRSLLGVMYFLSLSVQVPPQHQTAGFVTHTVDRAGTAFDWSKVLDPLMQIHSNKAVPVDAAVKVFYRQHWYWIADDDLNSKATFTLLRLLVFLKSGDQQSPSPLVTIPSR